MHAGPTTSDGIRSVREEGGTLPVSSCLHMLLFLFLVTRSCIPRCGVRSCVCEAALVRKEKGEREREFRRHRDRVCAQQPSLLFPLPCLLLLLFVVCAVVDERSSREKRENVFLSFHSLTTCTLAACSKRQERERERCAILCSHDVAWAACSCCSDDDDDRTTTAAASLHTYTHAQASVTRSRLAQIRQPRYKAAKPPLSDPPRFTQRLPSPTSSPSLSLYLPSPAHSFHVSPVAMWIQPAPSLLVATPCPGRLPSRT